jgi:hypothetical protein
VPSWSKFDGASHRSIISRTSGHSSSRIEYQAVSRFRPLKIMWLWLQSGTQADAPPHERRHSVHCIATACADIEDRPWHSEASNGVIQSRHGSAAASDQIDPISMTPCSG